MADSGKPNGGKDNSRETGTRAAEAEPPEGKKE